MPFKMHLPGPDGVPLAGDSWHGFRVAKHFAEIEFVYVFILAMMWAAFIVHPDPPCRRAEELI